MKARLINGVSKKYSTTYNFNDGLNVYAEPRKIKDNQIASCSNISNSLNKSSICTREGKRVFSTKYTNVQAIGKFKDTIYFIADKKWYKTTGAIEIPSTNITVDSDYASFSEFNTGTEQMIIFTNGTNRISYNGTTFTELTNSPTNSYYIAANVGRLFWIKGNKIIFSALQMINDYTSENGGGEIIVTDCSKELTAIASYDGKIIVWDKHNMWVLYGTDSTTFQLIKINGGVGCNNNESVTITDNVLYWGNQFGIYAYNGSIVESISQLVDYYFKNRFAKGAPIYCGSFGKRLYISITMDASDRNTLEYDIESKKWYFSPDYYTCYSDDGSQLFAIKRLDETIIIEGGTTTQTRYQLSAIKQDALQFDYLKYDEVDSETVEIVWDFTTKVFDFGLFSSKKTISMICIEYLLSTNNSMRLLYKCDNGSWITFKQFESNGYSQIIKIPVQIFPVFNTIQFKFQGIGYFEMNYMEIKYRIKPR